MKYFDIREKDLPPNESFFLVHSAVKCLNLLVDEINRMEKRIESIEAKTKELQRYCECNWALPKNGVCLNPTCKYK